MNKSWNCVQTIFFDVRGYFEISVYEISKVDYTGFIGHPVIVKKRNTNNNDAKVKGHLIGVGGGRTVDQLHSFSLKQ